MWQHFRLSSNCSIMFQVKRAIGIAGHWQLNSFRARCHDMSEICCLLYFGTTKGKIITPSDCWELNVDCLHGSYFVTGIYGVKITISHKLQLERCSLSLSPVCTNKIIHHTHTQIESHSVCFLSCLIVLHTRKHDSHKDVRLVYLLISTNTDYKHLELLRIFSTV